MANLYIVDPPINREQRNNINDTFQDIQSEIGKVVIKTGQIKDEVEDSLDGLQSQINTLVVDGDSSPEAAQARLGYDGTDYDTLKDRLDSEIEKSLLETQKEADRRKSIEVSVMDYGAKGDGVTTENTFIQEALNTGLDVVVEDGLYMINGAIPLTLQSNQTLRFTSGAKFKIIPNSSSAYTALWINGKENVKLLNVVIEGERYEHTGTVGEFGVPLRINNSKNITISGGNFSKGWGDGIYIGSATGSGHSECENIVIDNVICEDNRRLGLALTAAKNVKITNSIFSKNGINSGFDPRSGIDIEPNTGFECNDIYISKCNFSENDFGGLLVSVHSGGTVKNVNVENSVFNNNFEGIEAIGANGFNIFNCIFENHTRNSINCYLGSTKVNVESCDIKNSGSWGIRFFNTTYCKATSNLVESSGENNILVKSKNSSIQKNESTLSVKPSIVVESLSEGTEITENKIYNNNHSGLQIYSNDCRVLYNDIHDNSKNTITATTSNAEVYAQRTVFMFNKIRLGETGLSVFGVRASQGVDNIFIDNDISQAGTTRDLELLTQTNLKSYRNSILKENGITADRPTNAHIGFSYFDTTINKPVFWIGTDWVDASGAIV